MKYLQTFENYNDELILEKIEIKSLINKFKNSINKKVVAVVIVAALLSVMTIEKSINYINNLDLEETDKVELVEKISKYKDPTVLTLSQSGWDHIREFEKLRLKAYRLGDGMVTIGYGHAKPLRKSKYRPGQKITIEEAERLLISDVRHAADGVRRMFDQWKEEGVDVKITQNQFDVLVSLAFNMGISGLRGTEFVSYIKTNELDKAADVLKKTGINKKFPGLEIRRQSEYEKFIE